VERKIVATEVVGKVHVLAHEDKRSWETACNYTLYQVPEQDADLVTERDNYGACWHSVKLDAVEVESYYVNRLFTSSEANHHTGLNKPTTVYHSQPGPGMLDYFVGVLNRNPYITASLL